MEIKIERLDHQGRGIGKIEGKTIFIPNALPDEIVDADILINKKKFMIGEVKKIMKASKLRKKPICPYFATCGGCDLMHLSYEKQLEYKEDKVKDIMVKFADISDTVVQPIIGCDETLYYRNKVTFQVNQEIGFYEKKSDVIVPVDKCYIVTPKTNRILKKLKSISLQHIKQIVLRTDDIIDEIMLILYVDGIIEEQEIVERLKDDVTSIIKVENKKETTLYGTDTIVFELGTYQFELSPSSFFQVNTKQCQKLYDKVVEYADIKNEDTVLDLYCGTGTIGIYLSQYANQVYGIEINPDAIKNANRNKERNHITNIDFKVGDVGKVVHNLKLKPDVVVVDPPRKGLDEHTIAQLLKWKPKKIVYVSCDPVTLARDLKYLKTNYEVQEMTLVDMFPETYHVENVVLMSKKM